MPQPDTERQIALPKTGGSGPRQGEPEYAPQAVQAIRTATLVNLTLSQMADQKASMLIGAALVVFTIALGQLPEAGQVPPALLVLATFSFLTALLSVAVVMPSVGVPRAAPDTENLMFFGAFTQLDEAEFTERVLNRLHTDDAMFRMMLRDIHQNGLVLRRKKYRLLAIAYRTMLAGMVLSAAVLVIGRIIT